MLSILLSDYIISSNYTTIQLRPFDQKNPFLAPITVNRELYKGPRSCMHIEIDIRNSKLRYEAGDHVAIYPQNDTKLVERIGQLLNADLNTVFTLKNLTMFVPFGLWFPRINDHLSYVCTMGDP